jgi:hypothetical protein
MGLLELDAENIVQAVQAWQLGPCLSEARCQASLRAFLQKQFARSTFARSTFLVEHPVGEGRADIYAQLRTLLLCGKTKPEWVEKIRQYLAKLVSDRWFFRAYVVSKPITVRGKDGRFLPAAAPA